MKEVASRLPWLAAIIVYTAGIAFIFIQSRTLESDAARIGAIGVQAILALGIIHGINKVRGVIKDVGDAADKILEDDDGAKKDPPAS
jgi:hypothetical protein